MYSVNSFDDIELKPKGTFWKLLTFTEACCPNCKGVVYDAEKMSMNSGSYHKKCFVCTTCNRNLDYLLAVDGPNAKNVYCQSCYKKNFGPTEIK